jgi:2-dehydro-3-deoxygluconokinase
MSSNTHTVACVGETMAVVAPTTLTSLAESDRFTVTAGGAESNVASHLAALGVDTYWLSRLGDDALGDRIAASLESHGVRLEGVARDGEARTGVYFKDPLPGSHARVSYYRSDSAASRMSTVDFERWPMRQFSWVHTSGITAALSDSCSLLIDRILDEAATLGYGVSFDVNYRPALWDREAAAARCLEIALRSDVVLVGLDEAQTLWGTSTADEVAKLLIGVPHVVVKDSDIEAVEFLYEPDGARTAVRLPALTVEVIEAVGAGDAFAAAYLAGYLRGDTPQQRLSAGHSLAAWTLGSLEDHRPLPPALTS